MAKKPNPFAKKGKSDNDADDKKSGKGKKLPPWLMKKKGK